MTDEMKLHRQRAAGLKAQTLWDSPTVKEIFAEMEEDVRKGWAESKAEEKDRREEIYWYMRAVEEVKRKFQLRISTGKLAAKQLEELEEAKEQ